MRKAALFLVPILAMCFLGASQYTNILGPSKIGGVSGNIHDLTTEDLKAVLGLSCWEFSSNEEIESVDIGILEKGEFRSLEKWDGDHRQLKFFLREVTPGESRLVVEEERVGRLQLAVRNVGDFYEMCGVPQVEKEYFQLAKFFYGGREEKGGPRYLVVKFNPKK